LKKILILTAGFGEGHNSAARGLRDGIRKASPEGAHVQLHDPFAEAYGLANDWARVLYMGMISRTPRIWRAIYRWLDRQQKFADDYRFPYERAKVAVMVRSYGKAFLALNRAAHKAINAGKSREMLQSLVRDSEGDFQALTHGHPEWEQLQKALKSRNPGVLSDNQGL